MAVVGGRLAMGTHEVILDVLGSGLRILVSYLTPTVCCVSIPAPTNPPAVPSIAYPPRSVGYALILTPLPRAYADILPH